MATGVLVDANVILSRTTRDWLFLLRNETSGGMFTIHSTVDIVTEALYHLRRLYPNAPGNRTSSMHDLLIDQLDELVRDYEVDDSFPCQDKHDAHVHAAAVASGAGILLTSDKGFLGLPSDVADTLPYDIHAPDEFFTLIDDAASGAVQVVTRLQLEYWYDRDGEVDLPARLRVANCPTFAKRVADHIHSSGWMPQ